MQDYVMKIDDLKMLEENLLSSISGIQNAQEFGIFNSEEYDLGSALKIVSNCYEVARGKLAQAEVKQQIAELVERAKKHYIGIDDIEQILKASYKNNE